MTERTLILIKPDGVQRLLVGRILERYEQRGLKIVGLKLVRVDRDLAERHYAVHRDKPFFDGLVDFIISAPLVALALEGLNAIAVCRAINGATRPHEAAPGSIRGDFALETGQNLVHASDSPENAATELAMWFGEDELLSYERDIDRWVGGRRADQGAANGCQAASAAASRVPPNARAKGTQANANAMTAAVHRPRRVLRDAGVRSDPGTGAGL